MKELERSILNRIQKYKSFLNEQKIREILSALVEINSSNLYGLVDSFLKENNLYDIFYSTTDEATKGLKLTVDFSQN